MEELPIEVIVLLVVLPKSLFCTLEFEDDNLAESSSWIVAGSPGGNEDVEFVDRGGIGGIAGRGGGVFENVSVITELAVEVSIGDEVSLTTPFVLVVKRELVSEEK
jgi:hypothetical protein